MRVRYQQDQTREGSDKMILSVSRRTDIPNYYSEWFITESKRDFYMSVIP